MVPGNGGKEEGISPVCHAQMEFFKISPMLQIPKDQIEAVCIYDTLPARRFARRAMEEEKCMKTFSLTKGKTHSVIITVSGDVYLARNYPQTYFEKLRDLEFLKTDSGCFINRNLIRQILAEKNGKQRKRFEKNGKENRFLDLTRGKAAGFYMVMESGMVYACHLYKWAE